MASLVDLISKLIDDVKRNREVFRQQIYKRGSAEDGPEVKIWYLQECIYMWTSYNYCKFQWWEWPSMRRDILETAKTLYGEESPEYKKLERSLPRRRAQPRF